MAALAVSHLHRRGVGPVRILNRSLEHARALAERTNAEHGDLDALPHAMANADLVVSATGAAGHVVRADALAGRTNPLVLVDLAIPRDVEPACADLEGVTLLDIVALRDRITERSPETAEDIAAAHELIGEEVRRWASRKRGDELAPVIRALQAHGERAVVAELERWSARLSDLTPEQREAVEALARGVAAKILHDPITAVKERGDRIGAKELSALLGLELDE
jgi:glutamyl-tRNA reductase